MRGSRPGKQVQLAEYEIKFLCTKAREIFINQPILLELEAPIKICGMRSLQVSRFTPNLIKVIFTVNITICCDCLNMEDSRQKQIISSSAITWIVESSPSKRYVFCWHTRSNIQKTFLSSEATTSALVSTESMGFTTSVRTAYGAFLLAKHRQAKEGITLNCGRPLQIALIVYLSQPSSTKRSLRCMVACRLI